MKIGVISDTHIPKRAKNLPKYVLDIFNNVELILHAGDLLDLSVLDQLGNIAPVKAVCGNNDTNEVKDYLEKKLIIEVNDFKIGLLHGDGVGKNTKLRSIDAFEEKPDCIVFGHSHIPYNQVENEILLFNPGSPTDKRKQGSYSVGIIEVNNGIHGKIFCFDDKN